MSNKITFTENELFYVSEYSMENLYYILYYTYVDGSDKHFAFRKDPAVNSWSHTGTTAQVLKLLAEVDDHHDVNAAYEKLLTDFVLPESVRPAVEEIGKYVKGEKKVNNTKTTKASLPELVGQIIDIFEDYAALQEVILDNPERDEYYDGTDMAGDPEDNLAIIFGSDYDYIGDEIRFGVEATGISLLKADEKEVTTLSKRVVERFNELLNKNHYAIDPRDKEALTNKVFDTFKEWETVE